ncbi:DUF6572 domain-containing protein [Paenibacillus aurantiacus]|uniref:DUF6572 domain-containing protein n=1 Tax=Paenibacillus aurantiacus TaxID=1936118 RepID=A0ABV5KXF5_9BACL
MTLEKSNVLDVVAVNLQNNRVEMVIIDSLDWQEELTHLQLLQAKINNYLAVIENGEIYSVYEHAVGREFDIVVRFLHPFPESCVPFFIRAQEILLTFGIGFDYKVG